MKTSLLLIMLLCSTALGTLVGIEADDYVDYENISNAVPEFDLWRSTYRYQFDKIYAKVYAIPSTDNLLGARSIGWELAGYYEWWDEEPCLYITLNGLAKSVSIRTANRPNWSRKTVVVDCWDINGNQVAQNFDDIGSTLITDVGDYTISSVAIWTVGQMSIDEIEFEYIPEPATILIFGIGIIFGNKSLGTPKE